MHESAQSLRRVRFLKENLAYLKAQGLQSALLDTLLAAPEISVDKLSAFAEEQNLSLDHMIFRSLALKPFSAKMLVMDCDGVLTKGEMIVSTDGEHTKIFNVKDGMGIKKAQAAGLLTAILSHGHSTGVVEARAQQLGLQKVYVGKEAKLAILTQWAQEAQIALEDIVYVGDDINDLPALEAVGHGFCPADAVEEVKRSPKVQVLQKCGGEGCIRELVDRYLRFD